MYITANDILQLDVSMSNVPAMEVPQPISNPKQEFLDLFLIFKVFGL
jgi:hypothetical protein